MKRKEKEEKEKKKTNIFVISIFVNETNSFRCQNID